jgi:hypothetical protein
MMIERASRVMHDQLSQPQGLQSPLLLLLTLLPTMVLLPQSHLFNY